MGVQNLCPNYTQIRRIITEICRNKGIEIHWASTTSLDSLPASLTPSKAVDHALWMSRAPVMRYCHSAMTTPEQIKIMSTKVASLQVSSPEAHSQSKTD
ncbi:hypothetical protein GJ744_008852 [Endocarpon pusillum]|uniref:Uncharacterized protein n=1 Tax=Endocarpon pusillum TaxID=364733 RepID=A0A8H7AQT9_9EURO|nr:hypothetical protein GJ744_008852 [Endocarpon pusillum]